MTLTPQARYNREVRKCPVVRQIEAEKQKLRRSTPEQKSRMAEYYQQWKARKET